MKIFSESKESIVINGLTYEVNVIHREWNPIMGYLPPSESVWEVILTYGETKYCAAGDSREAALDAMSKLIDRMEKWNANPNKDDRLGV